MHKKGGRDILSRAMTTKDVAALAFGTMIGWGWVMLAGNWAASAGVVGAMLAFVAGVVLCIFVGLTYAELTPALPIAGGEHVFSYRAMGYVPSWLCGWMITFAYVGVAAWEGPALVTAIDYIVPIPRIGFLWNVAGFDVYFSWYAIALIAGLLLTIMNLLGVKTSAIFQTVATIALALGGIIFVIGGAIRGNTANLTPVFTNFNGFAAVVLMVPAMFVGFDVIPQVAEEMNIPLGRIAKILIASILLAAAWYILMIFGISISAPPEVRVSGSVPVADSFAYAMGNPVFGKLMIITAMCGILTSWNGFILGATRVLFSMGRAKMLPGVFGLVHPKYGSPTASIILVGIITIISPLLGKSALVWLVDASAFGTVVAYTMVAMSFLLLRKKEPGLERPYKVKFGIPVGVCAVGVGLFFLYLYLPIGPSPLVPVEWALVLGWIALGMIMFIANGAKNTVSCVSLKEREYLLFGSKYSRPEYR